MKVYGDADPSLTYQVSGLKNGDSAGSILTGGLNRAAGENAEFTGKALDQWAYQRDIKLKLIQPGKPTQNAFIESFNGKFRASVYRRITPVELFALPQGWASRRVHNRLRLSAAGLRCIGG